MSKKYELIAFKNKFITRRRGHYQIRALRDIPRYGVKAGDLGGFVHSDKNLSQEGDCWIVDRAGAYDGSRVSGNAFLGEGSTVFDKARIDEEACVSHTAVYHRSYIGGNAIVESCVLHHESSIKGNAIVTGARLWTTTCLTGETRVVFPDEDMGWIDIAEWDGEYTDKDYLVQGPALSSGNHSVAYRRHGSEIVVKTGCFRGSLDEYLLAIEETHRHNPVFLQQYREFHANFVSHFSS